MLSKILKLNDVQELNKKEQGTINGGIVGNIFCRSRRDCFVATGEFDWACVPNPYSGGFGVCVPL